MKKVIRLSEADLISIIEKVITEQATPSKSPQECAMLRKKVEKNKARGERVINFAPRALRDMLKKAFDAGVENGPEAFKVLNSKLKSVKMPKSDAEIESMISAAEMEAKNTKLQEQVKSVLGLIVEIGMILMLLIVLIILIRNADGDIAGYCG